MITFECLLRMYSKAEIIDGFFQIEPQEAVRTTVGIATLSPSVPLSYLASIPVVKSIIALVNKQHCSHPS